MKHKNTWKSVTSQKKMRKYLNLRKRENKIVLKDLYTLNINVDNDNKNNSTQNECNLTKGESENKLNPEGTSCVLPVPSEEICQGGCEDITTHGVECWSGDL